MAGPLEGIRVLDVTQGAAGPCGAMLLGQLGADVVKVEPPKGDWVRQVLPTQRGMGTWYIVMNLNKRGIILDLTQERDRNVALKLAERCDVFVENYRPGVMERLGLGFDVLSRVNPRIIYCSNSGYGTTGPLRDRGCNDPSFQPFCGSASVNGTPEGRYEVFRYYGGLDVMVAGYICEAILAGLFAREVTGKGQKIETSFLQAGISFQASRIAEYLATGVAPGPMGSARPNLVPDQAFKTLDQYINVTVPDERCWLGLCEALGIAELAADPRFTPNSNRVEHRAELTPILEQVFLERPSGWWLHVLQQQGVPCGPYRSFGEFRWDRHISENEMLTEVDTPWGRITVGGLPWKFSRTPGAVTSGPYPGQHTEAVCSEIGYRKGET